MSDDINALEKLNNYKKFGFTSSRAMIIAAINSYSQEEKAPLGIGSKEIEELAEHIVNRMKEINVVDSSNNNIKEDQKYDSETKNNNDEFYHKALSFMDTL